MECRICHNKGRWFESLLRPCKCTGTMGYLHKECLTFWLSFKGINYCEICNYNYDYKYVTDKKMLYKHICMMILHLCGPLILVGIITYILQFLISYIYTDCDLGEAIIIYMCLSGTLIWVAIAGAIVSGKYEDDNFKIAHNEMEFYTFVIVGIVEILLICFCPQAMLFIVMCWGVVANTLCYMIILNTSYYFDIKPIYNNLRYGFRVIVNKN